MKLLTAELLKRFKKVGNDEETSTENKVIICKFFNPTGRGTWYATEYNEKEKMFFGYVSIFGDYNDEWGYFTIDELEDFKGKFGLGIERDITFKEIQFKDLQK